MKRLTQRQIVLALLSDGGWHSSIEFVDAGVLRAAAHVFELRCSGFPIESRRMARQGSAPIFEWRLRQPLRAGGLLVQRTPEALAELEQEPAEPEQLCLDAEGVA